jgi:hypothetical protein
MLSGKEPDVMQINFNWIRQYSADGSVRGKLFLQLHGNKFFHCTVSRFFTAW